MGDIKYETKVVHYTRSDLVAGVLQELEQGWAVLFTIATNDLPPSYTNANLTFNSDGTFQLLNLPPQVIEVHYFKRDWHKSPCPRCEYPYSDPDRLDREI